LLSLAVAILMICLFDVGGRRFNRPMQIIGFALLFYSLLHPWEKKGLLYYGSLIGSSAIIFLLLIFVGIHIISNISLPGHMAEDNV